MDAKDNRDKEWLQRLTGTSNKSPKTSRNPSEGVESEHADRTPPVPSAGGGNVSIEQEKTQVPKKLRGFDAVAGMEQAKRLAREGFINVIKHREKAAAYGIVPPALLLYGPSGCGKTYFSEALAEEVGISFIKVSPDDIASKWVHGTQEKIAELFKQAEKKAPTLLFFDEFDAMVPKRTDDDRHNQNGEVNEFLVKLNNAQERGVYVVAATNHPEAIDRAVLRSGRIDEMIYIDMPDSTAREDLFRIELSRLPAADDIDLAHLAELTRGYNCSDISYIVKAAARKTFNDSLDDPETEPLKHITQAEIEKAISRRSPSVTPRDLREIERIRSEFSPKDSGVRRQAIGFTR